MILDWLVAGLILVGSAFSALAAVGILRMPDLYMRVQVATKASTLGVSCLVIAAALVFTDRGMVTNALLVVAFLFLTAPVAAHMIGRSAYASGIPLWRESVVDELRDASERLGPDRPADALPETDGPAEPVPPEAWTTEDKPGRDLP